MTWAVGERVVIQGLQSAVELNGQEGVVLEPLAENIAKGRVRVRVAGRELAVRPEALVLLDGEEDLEMDEEVEEEEEESDEEFEDDETCDEALEDVKPQESFVSAPPNSKPPNSQQSVIWCYGCFKEMKRSEANRCSKCRVAMFCSRDCQKKCHPYHQVSCRVPNLEGVKALRGSQVLHLLQQQFHGGGPRPETACLLARMRSLLVCAYSSSRKEAKEARKSLGDDLNDIGLELHTMARIFMPSEEELKSYYNYFWAAPGMPEFLLGTELSTSRKHVPGKFHGRDEHGRFPEDYDMNEDFGEGESMAGRFEDAES